MSLSWALWASLLRLCQICLQQLAHIDIDQPLPICYLERAGVVACLAQSLNTFAVLSCVASPSPHKAVAQLCTAMPPCPFQHRWRDSWIVHPSKCFWICANTVLAERVPFELMFHHEQCWCTVRRVVELPDDAQWCSDESCENPDCRLRHWSEEIPDLGHGCAEALRNTAYNM